MSISPEIRAALQQLLSEPESNGSANTDATQDMKMVLDIMEEKLTPVFEHIGKQFQAYENRICELENLMGALVTSMSDAVDGHRRTGISSSIKENYGSDLDSLGPIYSDMTGDDLTETLIDAFMQDGGEMDEAVPRLLGPIRERFGKYSMKPQETAPSEPEKPSETPQGELELTIESEPGGEKPDTAESEKPKSGRASDKLFEQMGNLARKTA